MKLKALFILILTFASVNGFSQTQLEYERLETINNIYFELLESLEKVRSEIIEDSNFNSHYMNLYLNRFLEESSNIFVFYSPSHDIELEGCQQNQILAYINYDGTKNIYFCNHFFEVSESERMMTILHESIHALGLRDECLTERITYRLIELSGNEISEESAYYRLCNMSSYDQLLMSN